MLPCPNACQAQEPLERRIGIGWRPYGAELKRRIGTRNRTKNHLRKWGCYRRFAGETHTLTHRNKMHHSLAANIHLLRAWCMPAAGEVLYDTLAKRTTAIR